MKVLFVATVVKTHIMTFHIPYLQWFKEQGWEVHVCARNDYPASDNWNGQIPSCDRFIDLPFARSPFSRKNFSVYRHLKHLIDQEHYDLIHCHTPVGGVLTRLAAQKARHYGTRVLYTAHGFHFFAGAPWKNWLLYYPVELWLAHLTDVLITINQEDFARAKKMKARRVEYVPGVGVDFRRFAIDLDSHDLALDRMNWRRQNNLPDDSRIILAVGELISNKNHAVLVKALALVQDPDTFLVICGTGPLESSIRRLANDLNLSAFVRFLGYRQDLSSCYRAADIFMLPSWREGLSRSLMEAMASGLPCIVSRIRGNTELIQHGQGGLLCDPGDVRGFATAIQQLIKNPSLRKSMGQNNQREISAFDLKKIMATMTAIYLDLKPVNYESDSQQIRILHLLSSDRLSGAEQVVCLIIRLFRENPHIEMAYCSPEGPIRDTLIRQQIDYFPLSRMSGREIRRVLRDYQPDIIQAHDIRAGVLAAWCGGSSRKISQIHGNHFSMRTANLKSLLYGLSARRFQRIVWVSRSALKHYCFRSAVRGKSLVLPNIIDPSRIKAIQPAADIPYDIVFLGRFAKPKNPERLLSILQRVVAKKPDVKVAMIGGGELLAKTRSKADRMGLAKNLVFLGYLTEPLAIVAQSRLMLLTSRSEGVPISILEALGLGVPVVSTPVDGICEIIQDGMNGYLSDDDENLTQRILAILEDDLLHSRLSAQARSRFEEWNCVDTYRQTWQQVYGVLG